MNDANDTDSLTPDAPAPADVPAAPEGGEAPAKPARRRRAPRKTAAASETVGDSAPEAAGEGAAPAEGSDPVARAVAVVVAEAGGEPVGSVEGVGEDAASQAAAAPAGEGGEPRSGRNRRRNRRGRGKDRAERSAEGAEGNSEQQRPPREPRPQERREAAAVPAPSTGELFEQLLSGEFDVETENAEGAETAPPPKRVLAAEPDAPKLHKVLAQAGVGSRRDMEQMIVEGRVTVNGEPAHIGQRISFGDQVRVNGKPVKFRIAPPPPRVIAYHKPVGEVVTHDDPQQRPTVFRKLPKLHQGKWQSVGRLDINTEGLLLFSNSGELANQLMHPRFNVEREYAVRVLGTLDDEAKARLLEGVEIDGQKAGFKAIEDAGGSEGVNHWYRVVITEGRNREVRKLFDAVGLTVNRLIRVRYGTVVLPRGLKRGVWVELDENDVRTIRRLAGGDAQPRGGKGNDARGGGGKQQQRGGKQGQPQPQRNRGGNPGGRRGGDELGPIPNPLQQTYDKRALLEERNQRRIAEIDDEDGPIPNPLQQTYDKRFVQKPRGAGGSGGGAGGGRRKGGSGGAAGGGGGKQPDPMQTSVGYIGADAFLRTRGGGGGGKGRGGRRGR
jgi:23S rRNA pseudouridine2605 synthase